MFDVKKYNKKYYQENKEYFKEYYKEYCINNPEYFKDYCQKNKDRRRKNLIKWRKNNPEYDKKWHKIYYWNNKILLNLQARERRKTDLKFNLNRKISLAIYRSLRNNKVGKHWENLVGYTLNDLIKYLKKTIPKDYTWQDYLEGKLHIDHIIPISVFNFTESEHIDFQRCWALNNLQLLPAKENLIKNNKLLKPFQPALAI
jgi:5-methylcytosine-specific restriction endonuclease McrA